MVDQGQGSINGPGRWSEPDDEPKAVLPRATAFFGCRWWTRWGWGLPAAAPPVLHAKQAWPLGRARVRERPLSPAFSATALCPAVRRACRRGASLSPSDAAAASLSIASCPPRARSQHSNPVPSRLSPSSCPLSFVRFVSPAMTTSTLGTVVRQRGARPLSPHAWIGRACLPFVRSFVNAASEVVLVWLVSGSFLHQRYLLTSSPVYKRPGLLILLHAQHSTAQHY